MAGEFYTLSTLFRLGHEASLTLSNAKSIDILSKSPSGNLYQVQVKAVRAGGKWGVGRQSYANVKNLVFVFLLFNDFDKPNENPEAWIIPAKDVEKLKQPWLNETSAIYYSGKEEISKLADYKNAWSKHLA